MNAFGFLFCQQRRRFASRIGRIPRELARSRGRIGDAAETGGTSGARIEVDQSPAARRTHQSQGKQPRAQRSFSPQRVFDYESLRWPIQGRRVLKWIQVLIQVYQ